MAQIKVLIAFKKNLVRELLTKVIQAESSMEVVGSCCNGEEVIEKVFDSEPDVIILDNRISDCSCVDVIKRVKEHSPNVSLCIILSSEKYKDPLCSLKLGASAYVTLDVHLEELIHAINVVYFGDIIISKEMAQELDSSLEKIEQNLGGKEGEIGILSKREKEVLLLVAEGYSNKQIAKSLFISENTVKVHLGRILEKMHLQSRQQVMLAIMRKGYVAE